ncbi:hypothetical protein [Polaromonas sp. UBA4122]|uniref:hypothetical protein n=1 Tax=Polaromonas sp. UBA4122 TaxID=1947074 RepID=UPI0025F0A7C5|nr:hypothetical protein [Polaromonas sp. UBA4122]
MKQTPRLHVGARRRCWPIAGLCGLLLASASQAQNDPAQQPAEESTMWLAASNHTLDHMRGGFDFGAGLFVSFGISRAVYINDQLVTTMSLQLGDITKLTPAQAAALGQQIISQTQVAQNGPGNTVEPGPVIVPLATYIQNTLNNQTIRNQTAQPAVPGQQIAPQAQVVQNGPGNTVEPGAVMVPLATYIQNTLNNQTIRNQTVIQAATNGLGILKSLNLQATISQAIANAIANR